ncbi:MAG: hypothetical protein EOO99_10825 [Pedobacter sp.]|nr:MAG: hypothetical protein EOO99_10825 [Pedobacter sp.]
MKKIFLSLLLVGVASTFANAQKNEVSEAKRLWTIFQISQQQAASGIAPKAAAREDGPSGTFSSRTTGGSSSRVGSGGGSTSGSTPSSNSNNVNLSPNDRLINSIKQGLVHTEKAIVHDKTKGTAEAWAYHSLFTSTYAFLDSLNQENSVKYQKIAEEAISKTEALDANKSFKEEIATSKLNIRNAIVVRALKAYNNQDFKSSYNHFSEVIQLTPNDTTMYMNMGLIAKLGKMYPEAISNYKKYANFGGQDAKDYYLEMVTIAADLMKDTTLALSLTKEGLEKFPEDAGLVSAETDIYIARGDIEKSQSSLAKLIAKDDKKAVYHFLMGETYYKQALNMQNERNKIDVKKVKEYEAVTAKMIELIDKSLPHYRKALDLDPNFEPTLEMLKQIYGFKNDVDNFNDIKKRIDSLPKN